MELFTGIMAGLGFLTSAWGQISSAQAQEEAAKRDAALKREQADELLSRQNLNEHLARKRLDKAMTHARSSAAGYWSADTALSLAEYQLEGEQAILDSRREAEFKARMLRAGADIETDLASDAMTGAWLNAGGTILTGAYKIGSVFKGASDDSKDLPWMKDSRGFTRA